MLAKRCLIGLQKGVNMTSKGHLLQAKRASFRVQLSINKNLRKEKSLHNRQFVDFLLAPIAFKILIGVVCFYSDGSIECVRYKYIYRWF